MNPPTNPLAEIRDLCAAAQQAGKNFKLVTTTGLLRKEKDGRLYLAWSAEFDVTADQDAPELVPMPPVKE